MGNHNITIGDLVDIVAFPLLTMVCDDMLHRLPLAWEHWQKLYYMIALDRVLLQLMHMWALTLSLPFVVAVLNIAQKDNYRIALLD